MDYFEPSATEGPYSFTNTGYENGYESPGAKMPLRGVPVSPDAPGDIVPPVEIGAGREVECADVVSPSGGGGSGVGGGGGLVQVQEQETPTDESIGGRSKVDGKAVPATAAGRRIELP